MSSGRSQPVGPYEISIDAPYLFEERHDIVDYRREEALGFLTVGALFDQIAALLRMLVEGHELTSFIFVDHSGPVA